MILKELKSGRKVILVKVNYQVIQVMLDEVIYIKALSDYITIFTTHGKYVTLNTMKDAVSTLPVDEFTRTHRSYIVNVYFIERTKGPWINIKGQENDCVGFEKEIPIGRSYKNGFRRSFLGTKPRKQALLKVA
jgi:DNA-binding LytR/AlgR family response regulator